MRTSGGTARTASASKAPNQVHRTLSIASKQVFRPQIADFINSIDPTQTCAWFSRSGSRYVLRVPDATPGLGSRYAGERALMSPSLHAPADEVIE